MTRIRVAAFLHEHLPEHFPHRVDMIVVGGYVLVDITLRMLEPAGECGSPI